MRIQSWDSTYRYAGTLAPETYQLFRQPHQKEHMYIYSVGQNFVPGHIFVTQSLHINFPMKKKHLFTINYAKT